MSIWDTAKTKGFENYVKMHNALSSTSHESKFAEGTLTPEEFVRSGDALVHKCPTWKWGSGQYQVDYLPKEKQYLYTENVPCFSRVENLEMGGKSTSIQVEGDDDDWVGMTHEKVEAEEIPEMGGPSNVSVDDDDDDDDDDGEIPDLGDFDPDENEIVDNDNATLDDNILKTRTYDINITYDKYYQTPRVWLFGYDENRKPLKPSQIFTDISADHAKKTVTIDSHPHLCVEQAYIHPCKHAPVMKKFMDNLSEAGKELRVDQYMPIFLKFISSVIPTIEYDYTF